MDSSYHIHVVGSPHGRGHMTFFDEPFGEQTPFEFAGGYSIAYECGVTEVGPISSEELAEGLYAWLLRNHWRKVEELEALVEV